MEIGQTADMFIFFLWSLSSSSSTTSVELPYHKIGTSILSLAFTWNNSFPLRVWSITKRILLTSPATVHVNRETSPSGTFPCGEHTAPYIFILWVMTVACHYPLFCHKDASLFLHFLAFPFLQPSTLWKCFTNLGWSSPLSLVIRGTMAVVPSWFHK